jgi:glycosyltransferase involved in cell wall biosynthesis
VNDGDKIECPGYNYYFHNNEVNLGVGKSKNIALKHLLNKGCDHIFLIEDDIFILDPSVFERYIEASKITGIQHFNFSLHGVMNKKWEQRAFPDVIPNPRVIIDYKSVKIPLYPHCVGAFSYYSRECLETVGLIDEKFYNACEHVDHTYKIIKAGMHPPFWFFADIENSGDYLGDEPWDITKSTISSNPNHQQMMIDADKIFVENHGLLPRQIPFEEQLVGPTLKQIKNKYGRPNDSNL